MVMGLILGEVTNQYKREQEKVKRRNSASERMQVPVYQGKTIKKFLVGDDVSVTEADRNDAIRSYEAQRKKAAEWRAQH